MSRSSVPAPAPAAAPGLKAGYQLTSDLARFCLPAASQDPHRRLAWVNSVCLLFVAVGFIGLKTPDLMVRRTIEVTEVVPVIFEQPEPVEQPPQEPQEFVDEEPMDVAAPETPVVATIVAADPNAVAFAVPVEGNVVVTRNANIAQAPPPPGPRPSRPPPEIITFRPSRQTQGFYPPAPFLTGVLRSNESVEGKLYVEVDSQGNPAVVEVHETCGVAQLDRHTAKWIKGRWKFAPQEAKYYVPFEYRTN